MTLSTLVTTLEESKQLAALGYKQESYFWWVDTGMGFWNIKDAMSIWMQSSMAKSKRYSAYTLQELIELAGEEFYDLKRVSNVSLRAEAKNGKIVLGPTPISAVVALLIELLT